MWAAIITGLVTAVLGFVAAQLRQKRQENAQAELDEAERAVAAYRAKPELGSGLRVVEKPKAALRGFGPDAPDSPDAGQVPVEGPERGS